MIWFWTVKRESSSLILALFWEESAIPVAKQKKFVRENIGVRFYHLDSGKQIRMNKDRSRLLFRKSDKVLLEFKCDEAEVTPSRGVRLESGNIADFCYSQDSKYIYIISDDGVLHFRSKNLDKDYVIDKSRKIWHQRANTLVSLCQTAENISLWVLTLAKTQSLNTTSTSLSFKEAKIQFSYTRSASSPTIHKTGWESWTSRLWVEEKMFSLVALQLLVCFLPLPLEKNALNNLKRNLLLKIIQIVKPDNSGRFSCLASKGNTVWICSTENKINKLTIK